MDAAALRPQPESLCRACRPSSRTAATPSSPLLNRQGERVGLAVDGTLDAVISNWNFKPRTTRCIHMDLRYMLWQMKVVDKAEACLTELGSR